VRQLVDPGGRGHAELVPAAVEQAVVGGDKHAVGLAERVDGQRGEGAERVRRPVVGTAQRRPGQAAVLICPGATCTAATPAAAAIS